jgi:hypothetical protein
MGEPSLQEILLGSDAAKIALDLYTREVGYGYARQGEFQIITTPVGTPPPPFPGKGYKAALAMWAWNPEIDVCRASAVGAIYRDGLSGVVDKALTYKEQIAQMMVPVAFFFGRAPREYPKLEEVYDGPLIRLIGFLPRDKTPFAVRPPTWRPSSQLEHKKYADFSTMLEIPYQPQAQVILPPREKIVRPRLSRNAGHQAASKRDGLKEILDPDDGIPENL